MGQQTSSNNSDIQRIEETALEGSTGCFRNKDCRPVGEQVGQQTSNNNSDIQRIEETALEGSTGCFRNKENQFMLGS